MGHKSTTFGFKDLVWSDARIPDSCRRLSLILSPATESVVKGFAEGIQVIGVPSWLVTIPPALGLSFFGLNKNHREGYSGYSEVIILTPSAAAIFPAAFL